MQFQEIGVPNGLCQVLCQVSISYYGPFILELGDGGYTSDGEFNAVGIGVTASNDKYSCTWTLNPDSGQAYLVATMGL